MVVEALTSIPSFRALKLHLANVIQGDWTNFLCLINEINLSLWRIGSVWGAEFCGPGFTPCMAPAVWQRLAKMYRLTVVVTSSQLVH